MWFLFLHIYFMFQVVYYEKLKFSFRIAATVQILVIYTS